MSLTLRLGVHTGPLIVNAINADLRFVYTTPEATLEVATGLQQCAAAGIIAVSAAVHEAAAGFFRFTALGQYLLPESPAPVHVYTCDGVGMVTSRLAGALARGQTTLQGRTRELAFLENCWTRVCRGAGQVVCLIGEAGIGKSRLAYECQQMLAEARWLTLQALPYGQAMPYHAFLPLLRTVLGVQEHADPIQQQALQTHLAAFEPSLAAEAPFLAHLLGLPVAPEAYPPLAPEVQRRRVQQADEAPLGILVEDGHWLDPSSQELLDLLVAALARRRIFVLCTARPGFRHLWADYTYFHQVAITPLAAAETEALLQDLLQPYGAAPVLQAWLYARTGGNPFFVEELVPAPQVHGLLTVQAGVYTMAASPVTLPASIQGIVQTRLDRLPAEEKRLLQVAAVIGSDVPFPLLQASAELPAEAVHRGLAHLQAAEFLYETGLLPDVVYTFKHALTHEVAYGSRLHDQQCALHARLVAVLERTYVERPTEAIEQLAEHAYRGELWTKAITYLRQAGAKAAAQLAPRAAVVFLDKALLAVTRLPRSREMVQEEIDIRLALRNALVPLTEYEQVAAHLRAAERLATEIGEQRRLGWVFIYLSNYLAGHSTEAQSYAERARGIGKTLGETGLVVATTFYLAVAYHASGDYDAAEMVLRESVGLLQGERRWERYGQTAFPAVHSRWLLGEVLAMQGRFDDALVHSREAVQIAETLDHPYSLAYAYRGLGSVHLLRGELRDAQQALERARALCSDWGFTVTNPTVTGFLGFAYALAGRLADGVSLLREGLRMMDTHKLAIYRPLILAYLAEALMYADELEEAQQVAREALAAAQARRERGHVAHALRAMAEIAGHQGRSGADEAAACYGQATATATSLRMRPLVAHCHRGLGTLYATMSQWEQARTELSAAITLYRTMDITF